MKLTSQEEYGLRCILSLARVDAVMRPTHAASKAAESLEYRGPKTPLTVGKIAEVEGLSVEYAGKLLGILNRAGLVDSVRGRNGGYRLARSAEAISLAEVLDALGEKFYTPDTCERFAGDHGLCVHTNACSIRSVWAGIQLLIDRILARTSLLDLVKTHEGSMTDWMERHLTTLATFNIPVEDHAIASTSRTDV